MITVIRSAMFAAAALTWTVLLFCLYLPLLLLPRRVMQQAARFWAFGLRILLAITCGIIHRIRGREHLPKGAAVIAAKHQSAWDTIIFHGLLDDPVFVLKRELLDIPVFGWYLRATGNIGIDRSAGFRALRSMLPEIDRRLAEGAQIIVFPEGTRVAPGSRRRYNPGIAAIYARARVAVVPVALNSGLFWRRRGFLKFPGAITLEFLPPMPQGLGRDTFLAELERRIEDATTRLITEARANSDRDEPAPAARPADAP